MKQQSKPLKDVRPLYKGFIQHLSKPKNHKKLAQLQPLCRLEDYLTKEFAAFIIERSHESVRPRFNFGKRADGCRIDLALTTGDFSKVKGNRQYYKNDLPTIRGFVELKYLCYGNHYSNATDDIEPTLKSLHTQLKRFEGKTFAGHPVKLRSPKGEIYGIAFVSHVQHPEGGQENAKQKMTADEFRNRITEKAKGRFQSFNFKRPNLKPVYRNARVQMLGADCRVSLFAGLWRRVETPSRTAAV